MPPRLHLYLPLDQHLFQALMMQSTIRDFLVPPQPKPLERRFRRVLAGTYGAL
jgi:hypothetical protein